MARQDGADPGGQGLIESRATALRVAIGGAAAGAALLAFDPFRDRGIGCPFHRLTGLDCPGCGITRAAARLLHGDLAGAAHHNVLLLPIVVGVALWWVHSMAPARTPWLSRLVRPPATWSPAPRRAVVVAVLAFTVLRNLPAFAWLAPPDLV